MNDDGKEKMEQISKIIDAMPESADERMQELGEGETIH